jgi:hypothetical protein
MDKTILFFGVPKTLVRHEEQKAKINQEGNSTT